jgi:hypothetical protein
MSWACSFDRQTGCDVIILTGNPLRNRLFVRLKRKQNATLRFIIKEGWIAVINQAV